MPLILACKVLDNIKYIAFQENCFVFFPLAGKAQLLEIAKANAAAMCAKAGVPLPPNPSLLHYNRESC